MSHSEDRLFITDMLARIELIAEFTEQGKDAFLDSRMIQEAVIRSLEIIGEASRNVSEELREAHPDVPWRQITAFRNFVIHVYWDIKLERIWEIVDNDLPTLKPQLAEILQTLSSEESDDDK